MVCVTVALWHSNTQQCLQAAHSVHLESLCYWKSRSWYWTCSSVNLCSMWWIQLLPFQSTPVLSLQAVWSKLCSSCWENKRPDRWWSDVDLAAQSQRLAGSTVHTSHLWMKTCWVLNQCNNSEQCSVIILSVSLPQWDSQDPAASSSSRATENMVAIEGDLMGASLLLLQLTAWYQVFIADCEEVHFA